jgi:hypothetical protein
MFVGIYNDTLIYKNCIRNSMSTQISCFMTTITNVVMKSSWINLKPIFKLTTLPLNLASRGHKHTGIRDSPYVPNLTEKYPSFLMNPIYDWLPCFDLLIGPNARSVFVPCMHTENISYLDTRQTVEMKSNMTTQISSIHSLMV